MSLSFLCGPSDERLVRSREGRLAPGASEDLGSLGPAELSPDSLDPVVQLPVPGPTVYRFLASPGQAELDFVCQTLLSPWFRRALGLGRGQPQLAGLPC